MDGQVKFQVRRNSAVRDWERGAKIKWMKVVVRDLQLSRFQIRVDSSLVDQRHRSTKRKEKEEEEEKKKRRKKKRENRELNIEEMRMKEKIWRSQGRISRSEGFSFPIIIRIVEPKWENRPCWSRRLYSICN